MKRLPYALGDTVCDSLTGFKGVVIGITDWLGRSPTVGVQSTTVTSGKPDDPVWFDAPRLAPVKGEKRIGFKTEDVTLRRKR